MTIALVQSAVTQSDNTGGTTVLSLPNPPTTGNLLVIALGVRSDNAPDAQSISTSGWTQVGIARAVVGNGGSCSIWYKFAGAGEGATHTITSRVDYKRGVIAEFSTSNAIVSLASATVESTFGPTFPVGLTMDDSGLAVSIHIHGDPDNGSAWVEEAGWSTLSNGNQLGFDPKQIVSYQVVGTGALTHTPTGPGTSKYGAVMAGFVFGTTGGGGGTVGPPYEAPPPGAAVVEIYAAEPGAYRWGIAHWGESVWSTAGWRDVTPESVDVEILWGSQRPELGILSTPDPASWAIDFYDPDRSIDPANAEGPYYGDLQPGLPVRVRHGGMVVRQGVAESIGYQHSREAGLQDTAYMRVTDIISVLGNARVPTTSTLSDTLFARARDAISAAGLTVTVLPDPASGDPALAPWVTGQDMSAWDWIADAAQSVLWIPYVTNLGFLGFREYANGLDRARRLGSPNLIGLQSIVAHNGLYSVVSALQAPGDGGAVITREATPKPRYGARAYARTRVTPNAGDWAMAVLTDRAGGGLRWVPGDVYPLTAADVDYFGELEAIERVTVYYPEADPAVVQEVMIVGGRIVITAKKDAEAVWSFSFEAAQIPAAPLVTEDGLTFLVRDDDPTLFLYPDG